MATTNDMTKLRRHVNALVFVTVLAALVTTVNIVLAVYLHRHPPTRAQQCPPNAPPHARPK